MKLWIFFAGFLTNAIVWRLQEHKYDDIVYPVVLLILSICAIALYRKVNHYEIKRG